MKKHLAFTLAEVLIVLGVLGVVAVMTIPNLIQSTQGREYRAGLKKGISTLNQAVLRNLAINNSAFDGSTATILNVFSSNLRDTTTSGSTITLADGMTVTVSTATTGILDVNGAAGPNTVTASANTPSDRYNINFNGTGDTSSVACRDDACRGVLRN